MADDIGWYSTAVEMLDALRARRISAVELAELHIGRIESLDPAINAIAVRTFERARDAAREADRIRSGGGDAPLLGLPVVLKESTQIAGLPQSAGIGAFAEYRPETDGIVPRRIFDAGAGLLGTTNVPVALDDWQADSPVYGRTNNPWDLARSPGGSTGGGAAALAAGMAPLEIGSDIGGSIRNPAAFCGVYGHRPSVGVVPTGGAFPFEDCENPAQVLSTQGPLARAADDLELMLDVIAGPASATGAWRLALPVPRAERLSELRVAFMPPTFEQPSAEMLARVDELREVLVAAGATVGDASPVVDPEAFARDYLMLLSVNTSLGIGVDERAEIGAHLRATDHPMWVAMADGLRLDAGGLFHLLDRREAFRAEWARFFDRWDVLVLPAALDVAFPHTAGDQTERMLHIDGRDVPYVANLVQPMWSIHSGHPSTAFPAGLSAGGLPLGLEAIGPADGDRTTIHFARLLEREWRGFVAPPG